MARLRLRLNSLTLVAIAILVSAAVPSGCAESEIEPSSTERPLEVAGVDAGVPTSPGPSNNDAGFASGAYPPEEVTAIPWPEYLGMVETERARTEKGSSPTAALLGYAARAGSVAHVRCTSVSSFEALDPLPIMSDVDFEIIEVLRGPAPQGPFRMLGGRIGERGVSVSTMEVPEPGNHYILFSRDLGDGSWGAVYLLTASDQGLLSVMGVPYTPAEMKETLGQVSE